MTCDACGKPLPPYRGTGRPRVRCEACAADKGRLGKAWRVSHPQAVDAYNLSRREAGHLRLRARVGLNSGEPISSSQGISSEQEQDSMSKTVRQPTAPDANKTVPPRLTPPTVAPGQTAFVSGKGASVQKPTGKEGK